MAGKRKDLGQVLLEFAEPLRELLEQPAQGAALRQVLAVAALAWNAGVAQRAGKQAPFAEQALELARQTFATALQAEVQRRLETLVQWRSKQSTRLCLVVGFELRFEADGAPRVEVRTQPVESLDGLSAVVTAQSGSARDWAPFYAVAEALWQVQPWRWMGDAQRFAVMDPANGGWDWCVCMGGGGEFYGVALYLGEAGLGSLESMLSREPGAAADPSFGLTALVLAYVEREELEPEELGRLRSAGFDLGEQRLWPQLQSHGADRMWQPAQPHELRRMGEALAAALELFAEGAQHPEAVLPDARGWRAALQCQVRAGVLQWSRTRVPVPSLPPSPVPDFDRLRAQALAKRAVRAPEAWQLDLIAAPGVVPGEQGRNYTPALLLIVDARRGAVLHVNLTDPRGREAWLQAELLQAGETLGVLPAALHVQRTRLVQLLEPVLQALGVRLELRRQLPQLTTAQRALEQSMFGRQRKR